MNRPFYFDGQWARVCEGCDGAGSFSEAYRGEPHLREPCMDCWNGERPIHGGFIMMPWSAVRAGRRRLRRAHRRIARRVGS